MTLKEYTDRLLTLRNGNKASLFINAKFKQSITEQPLCMLNLPSGNIVANDPICCYQTEPFTKKVKPGKYPVILYIHSIDDDKRVAFAEIRFSHNSPVKFELALIDGQDISTLTDDEFFGYGVDSGTGGFCDEEICLEYEKLGDIPTELENMLDSSYVDTYSVADYFLPNSDRNMAFFSSGYGDGYYSSYWGFDKDGNICSLITDFLTLDEE